MMEDLTGKSLGHYLIVERLGEGGMATVYKASDTHLDRIIAVKVIRREAFPPEQIDILLKRFQREAKALAQLVHPNIVNVIDYGTHEDSPYLVMNFLPGGTLKEKLGSPLPWQEATRLILPIARALQFAHARGIVHRDVKPSNILLTESGDPMLTDFGIAKILEANAQTLTGTGIGIGTPEYMAPEQWTGGSGPQIDVYSLGVVFYELVTGCKPYTADTPAGVLIKQLNEPLPRPTSLVPDLPNEVEELLLKALAKEPTDRFPDMAAFAEALEKLSHRAPLPSATVPFQSTQTHDTVLAFPEASLTGTIRVPPAPPTRIPQIQEPQGLPRKRVWPVRLALSGGLLIIIAGVILLGVLGLRLGLHLPMIPSSQASPTPSPWASAIPTTATEAPTQTANAILTGNAVVAYTCTDPLGCIRINVTDSIHIAYLLVITGPNSAIGIDSRNGVEIAIDDAGNKILGHPVLFDGQDGGCSADGGLAAATKLASDPSIVAIIGTSCSPEARSAEPLLSRAGFVTVSPSSTGPDLTDPNSTNHYPGFFRTAPNDTFQAAAAANFAYNTMGLRTATTVHDGSMYARSLAAAFEQDFQQYGGTITYATAIDPNQTDMTLLLRDIAAGKPQLIYFPIFLPAGAYLIDQARTTSGLENTVLMGTDGLYSPDVMKEAGQGVEGFLVSSPLVQGPAYDAFVTKYKQKFGELPISNYHAYAYDAFNIILDAIEKVAVKEADGTLYIPRQGLRDAVAATQGFQGLTGVLTCSPDGDCANPVIGVYKYHTGQYPPEQIWSSK
jgi:branched-chain amino acid transport system substrate-binding protein